MGRDEDKAQLNIQIESATKEEWREAANDQNRSLSGLIRKAVSTELNGENAPDATAEANTGGTVPEGLDDRLDALESNQDEVAKHLDEIVDNLQSIRTAVEADEMSDKAELMNRVFEALPRERDGYPHLTHGNPAALANELDVPERSVRNTIQQLRADMPGVVGHSSPEEGPGPEDASEDFYFVRES